jgi:cytochrome b561
MITLQNTEQRYGAAAVALHWLMVALLVALLALGLYMMRLPDVGSNTRKVVLILIHKQLGLLALVLAALRLAWRVGNALPVLVGTLTDWQKVFARFVHLCFYGLMFALPISGWLMSSAAGIQVSLFGLFDLPDLVPFSDYWFKALVEFHEALGYALFVCIVVHAGAALRHHFTFKDDTLRRMWP